LDLRKKINQTREELVEYDSLKKIYNNLLLIFKPRPAGSPNTPNRKAVERGEKE
jgi:hypothetical protein